MTEFSYPLPQDAVCHSYVLTVSPINVVGRGAPSSMPYIGTEAGMHAMRQLATHAVNKIVMDQSDINVGAMLGQKAQGQWSIQRQIQVMVLRARTYAPPPGFGF